jgi:hypothetical protein
MSKQRQCILSTTLGKKHDPGENILLQKYFLINVKVNELNVLSKKN